MIISQLQQVVDSIKENDNNQELLEFSLAIDSLLKPVGEHLNVSKTALQVGRSSNAILVKVMRAINKAFPGLNTLQLFFLGKIYIQCQSPNNPQSILSMIKNLLALSATNDEKELSSFLTKHDLSILRSIGVNRG